MLRATIVNNVVLRFLNTHIAYTLHTHTHASLVQISSLLFSLNLFSLTSPPFKSLYLFLYLFPGSLLLPHTSLSSICLSLLLPHTSLSSRLFHRLENCSCFSIYQTHHENSEAGTLRRSVYYLCYIICDMTCRYLSLIYIITYIIISYTVAKKNPR